MNFTKEELQVIREAVKFRGDLYALAVNRTKEAKRFYAIAEKIRNNKDDNPVPSIDNIICPRVLLRLECEKCGYSISECRYPDEKYIAENMPTIPCKHDLLQNGVTTDNEQPNCKTWPHIKCPIEGCDFPDCGNENY